MNENGITFRVKGKTKTEYEGKEGTAVRTEWLNNPNGPIAVLWDGDIDKTLANREDIDILE